MCSYGEGRKDLIFIDVAKVIHFKGKVALVLQIMDEVLQRIC